MENNKKSIKDVLVQGLTKGRQIPELGIAADLEPVNRILSIEGQDGGFVVTISSQGFDLNHKMALESYLSECCTGFGTVLIYFKNVDPKSFVPRKGPAPFTGEKKIPLVLRIIRKPYQGLAK